KTVRLKIDEKEVEAPEGMNLVEAAKRIGVHIPVFCYHPQLSVIAACRMCLVEVEGDPKLKTACSTEAAEGMSVRTESSAAREGQRSTLEFLLINHPLDCPICDKGGECPLQDLTYDFGPGKSRFREPKWRFKKPIDIGRWILLDRERCIMCMRCSRFCEEIAWQPELVLAGTTTGIQIATAGGLPFNSQFSGNTVDICPVGALLSKQYYLQARPWEITPTDTICSGCGVGCNVTLHTREGFIKRMIPRGALPRKNPGRVERFSEVEVKLEGARIQSSPLELTQRGHPEIDEGWLCDRGRFGFV
ncbi:MAG TPA: 2Fe-2S iron-sulfur cluster-binding protein, partial [Candidatus Manganitrophaceae bacterium]